MGFESIYTAPNTQAAKCLLPRNSIGTLAGRRGQSVRIFRPASHESVDLLLNVNGGLFHGLLAAQAVEIEENRLENRNYPLYFHGLPESGK